MSLRRGFTLVEIMVSLGIFAVVGIIITSVLLSATRLFGSAEAAKSASDEAVTVMALLREDLRRIVPARDGGWFHARLIDSSGNGLVAWLALNADPDALAADGSGGREVVAWWVRPGGELLRSSVPVGIGFKGFAAQRQAVRGAVAAQTVIFSGTGSSNRIITVGALNLSPWVARTGPGGSGARSFARPLTDGRPDWERLVGGETVVGPWQDSSAGSGDGTWDTDPTVATPAGWPTAVRIAVTMAGGGTLVRTTRGVELRSDGAGSRDLAQTFVADGGLATDPATTTLRMRGGAIPAGPGSAFRIGDEWFTATGFEQAGVATVDRGRRRSVSSTHARGAPILQGQTYSVVWRLGD